MHSMIDHRRGQGEAASQDGLGLDAHLDTLAELASQALISDEARARLRGLGCKLPPFRHGIFECRLAADEPQVDFCCKYGAGDLLDVVPPTADPIWRLLGDLSRELGRPDSVIGRSVDLLGLEFDVDQRAAVGPPSLFFAFSGEDTETSLQALDAIVAHVQGGLDIGCRDRLRHCATALPPGAHFNYVGLMLGRQQRALRIGIERITPQASILEYLARVGWDGPIGALRTFLSSLPAPLQRSTPVVALDVGERIGQRVGLEFLLCHDQAVREGRAREMLDHLVDLGLCSAEKRTAVLAWPEPSWCERFLGQPAEPGLHRIISHVKLSWSGDAEPRAKVYLETTAAL
jgi:hypothetical protein